MKSGKTQRQRQANWQHMNSPARDPRDVKPGLPEPLAKVLEKSVLRDRETRYQTAAEFRDALKAVAPRSEG